MKNKDKILKSKQTVINDLLKNNLNFELVGTNPEFKNRSSKTNFRCLICGKERISTAINIISLGYGCPFCSNKNRIKKRNERTFESFKKEVELRGYELISSENDVKGEKTNVSVNKDAIFKHSCGHTFKMRIAKFLEKGCHCSNCNTTRIKTDDEFINDLKEKYGDIFYLSDGDHYNGRHKQITLTCRLCKHKTTDFAYNFLTNGRCCSFCSTSKAERTVMLKFHETIEKNKKFDGLVYTQSLFIDFNLNNILLECDGNQHFESIDFFGGEVRYQIQREQDFTKDKFILDNNLYLIRIYSEEIIDDGRLEKIFNSSTTIEDFEKIFNNILIIKDGNIKLIKGKYKSFKIVEYVQANGNREHYKDYNEDIV